MIISRKIDINDEPMTSKSTGKRTVEIKYNGNRFVYAEICNNTNKILCMVHSSEEPEMNVALERLTPNENRSIVEIDATKNLPAASIISDFYELTVDNYIENLSDGTVFKYEYPEPAKLNDIFDIHNMTYNKNKNDYDEYKFIINNITSEEFKNSVKELISKAENSLAINQYKDSEIQSVKNYINSLITVIDKVDQGIAHWKMDFPVCDVPM